MCVFVAKRVMRWSFNRPAKEDVRVQIGRKEGNWPRLGRVCGMSRGGHSRERKPQMQIPESGVSLSPSRTSREATWLELNTQWGKSWEMRVRK